MGIPGWPVGEVNPPDLLGISGSFGPFLPADVSPPESSDRFEKAASGHPSLDFVDTVGTGIAIGTDALPPFDLDIYVSVGFQGGLSSGACGSPLIDGLSRVASCDMDANEGCAIVRLRLRWLGPFGLVGLDVIQPADRYGGRVWPAISPDGTKLAYVRKGGSSSSRQDSRLYVRDLNTFDLVKLATGHDVAVANAGRPLFPAWFGDNYVLWTASQNGSHADPDESEWALFGAAVWFSPIGASSKVALMGPDTSYPYANGVSSDFSDPDVRRPGAVTLWDFAKDRVVTHGSDISLEPAQRRPKPQVGPAIATGTGGNVTTETFRLGDNAERTSSGWEMGAGDRIVECHHPAFNPSGDRVMCHAHSKEVPFSDVVGGTPPTAKLSYVYEEGSAGDVWGNPVLPFDPGTPSRLEAALGAGMPASDCGHVYSFKQAQFCGSDDYVITTIFCRGTEDGPINHSRVVIARREPLKIWDVTALIEDLLGEAQGTLAAQSGTCGPPAS